MIDPLINDQGIAVLERTIQFAGGRHRLIVNNIANLDTPGYRPTDVSVEAFRARLGAAIDERRELGSAGAPLRLEDGPQVEVAEGRLTLHPEPLARNILFNDGSDRDLERTMQDLVENFMTFQLAAELMRGRFELINAAIRERA